MPVKGVIFDLDGTLLKADGTPFDGVRQMLGQLKDWGVGWAVTSNQGSFRARKLLAAADLKPNAYATILEVGLKKPSPAVCEYACKALKLNKNEVVYVGDDERTDAICAINSEILYFQAGWSGKSSKYGLKLTRPEGVTTNLQTFLRRTPKWYWTLNAKDGDGRPVSVHSLITARDSWNRELVRAARRFLKEGAAVDVGKVKYGDFLLLYFLTTIYLQGLHHRIDRWTAVPGHATTSSITMLHRFTQFSSKLFKDSFWGNLIVRHIDAVKAAFARAQHIDPGFINQTNTLHLNPDYRSRIVGKRIAVVDDFATEGYSFECARNLLVRSGAAEVVCFSVGRYPKSYLIKTTRKGLAWDPWTPQTFVESDFRSTAAAGTTDETALTDFENLVMSLRS